LWQRGRTAARTDRHAPRPLPPSSVLLGFVRGRRRTVRKVAMFPVSRLTACRFGFILLVWLTVPLTGVERDRDFERLAHDFAFAFEAGDMAAFAPLATESPAASARWQNVRSVSNTTECAVVAGERVTVLQA